MAKNTTNAKVNAQTSKMSKNEIANAAPAKSKFELFGEGINKYVAEHRDCVEVIEPNKEWLLKGVNLGKGDCDFRVKIVEGVSKSGRPWCKREMYRIAGEKETLVQFGTLKKKYLYKLMLNLVKGNAAHVKNVINPELVKKIASAIRADRSAFTANDDGFTGAIKDLGNIAYKEIAVTQKCGKVVTERQLFVNDQLTLKGVQLGSIANAFNHVGKPARKMADLMAEGEATIDDLI